MYIINLLIKIFMFYYKRKKYHLINYLMIIIAVEDNTKIFIVVFVYILFLLYCSTYNGQQKYHRLNQRKCFETHDKFILLAFLHFIRIKYINHIVKHINVTLKII